MDENRLICTMMATGLTGTGKSTMLNSIAKYIDNKMRKEEEFHVSDGCFTATRGI